MMNQQPFHQESRQPQERGLLIRPARTSRAKGLDLDQFEIKLMYDGRGLQRVTWALGPHARGGNPPELGVEKRDQPAGGVAVAVTKARHQPGYGIGLKRSWDRQSATQCIPPGKKIQKP